MELTVEQRAKIRERGIRVNDACDKCGRLLGAVRWTIRGQAGEWCSPSCRDGADQVAARTAKRAGRPKLKLSAMDREARRRAQVLNAVHKHRELLRKEFISPKAFDAARCNQKLRESPIESVDC
jgi:hypothetical protein